MKTPEDFNPEAKRVFVRCDFNVPLGEGEVLDDFRIEKAVPTLEYLVSEGAKVVIGSHLGRPGGERDPSLSLAPVQESLLGWLDRSVVKADGCIGKEIERWTREMKKGEILLLENLRFRKGEKKNEERFARRLGRLADLYLNEAFSVSHRRHASLVGVPRFLPAGVGFLFEKEIEALSRVLEEPVSPVVGVIGGAKVESKRKALAGVREKVDSLLVGGRVGEELKGEERFEKENIHFPRDGKRKEGRVLDIGAETIKFFKKRIGEAGTVFWAGPMGKVEERGFRRGTVEIAEAIGESQGFKVVGGGDTVSFLRSQGLTPGFDHLSTGGGAMLHYLARGRLPALEVLKEQ